jgi:hypothetical protein
LLAIIENARLSLDTPQPGQLVLDRIEIREIARKDEGKLIELALVLPKNIILRETDGTETKINLTDATADTVVEAESGRGRETLIEIAGARIDHLNTGTWASLGPLSMSSKLAAEPNGGWSGPVEFEVKGIEYFLPQGPVGGAIDRIAFIGKSAGPRLNELDKLRHAIDQLQADDGKSPQARGAAFLGTLSTISEPFSTIRGEFAVDGLTVRSVTGEDPRSRGEGAQHQRGHRPRYGTGGDTVQHQPRGSPPRVIAPRLREGAPPDGARFRGR